MENQTNRLLLIDTFYFLHRAFHSFPKEFMNSKGLHTNILFGFSKALLDSIAEFNPTHIVCGWESEELPSFRKTLYADYQKNRIPMELDDERIFSEQIPWVVKILDCFNIPRITHNGFEGDDALGTVASLAVDQGASVIIVTSDQDILQLITEDINVFRPARPPFVTKQLFDEQAFEEKYGFKPTQMIDYKALRGDPSDNIPGVKGIGDKTAKELISQFGVLENIYENLEKIKPAVRSKLEVDKEKAFMSKQLATIITDIPMDFKLSDAEICDFKVEKVQEIFNDLEFFSLKKDLDKLLKVKSVKDKLRESVEEKKQISLF